MYTGHLGIALGAKGIRPGVPLWAFVAASQACDWVDAAVWPFGHADPASGRWLVAGDWTAQMVSHSLPSVAVIALVLCALYYAATRDGRGAWAVAGVAISHVLADYVTAEKPTWPGGPRVGLSLYRHSAADFVVEAAVVLSGWLLYRRSLPPGRSSSAAAWLMLSALVALQLVASVTIRRALGTA
jgi:hypothetical protein